MIIIKARKFLASFLAIACAMVSCILIIILCCSLQKPADEIDDTITQAGSRLSKNGALLLKKNFIPHKEPCQSISIVGGWVWKCIYHDGFVTYNCFRKCRGTVEAARLFLGLNKEKDCDSFIIENGKRKMVCYPDEAENFLRLHGSVESIVIDREWP